MEDRPVLIKRAVVAHIIAVFLLFMYLLKGIFNWDPYRCKALLNEGNWTSVPDLWQPPGCIFHEYQKRDITDCLGNRRLVLIGDSNIRQIYWAVAKKMNLHRTEIVDDHKHEDLSFTTNDVQVQFCWDPFLNSSCLEKEMSLLAPNPILLDDISRSTKDILWAAESQSPNKSALLLLGNPGLWYARNGGENYFSMYKEAILRVSNFSRKHLRSHHTQSSVSWYASNLLLTPIQEPQYSKLSLHRAVSITPARVHEMQTFFRNASTDFLGGVTWSYVKMVSGISEIYKDDGLHVIDAVAERKADILLNYRCNSQAVAHNRYDRTCCIEYPPVPKYQLYFMTEVIISQLMVMISMVLWPTSRASKAQALLTFTQAILICTRTDRAPLFSKSNKFFDVHNLVLTSVIVFFWGALSGVKDVRAWPEDLSNSMFDHGFLARHQTEEWKGWMQAIILLYHYMGGSKHLRFYEGVRLLVASYLFITGFGHTKFFLQKHDYSLRRLVKLFFRVNLLSCFLSYVMRTEYMLYYYTPLVSFWILVVYGTMYAGHQKNRSTVFLFSKIVISATITTVVIQRHGILEAVFSSLQREFGVSWSASEFRFRVSLDLYIVYVGMICGILHSDQKIILAIQKTGNISTSNIAVSSIVFLMGFFAAIRHFPDKESYNAWHRYISFIPILAFIFLRNCHKILRQYHSKGFQVLGKFSLETFVLQNHLWLAGDSRGVLRIGILRPGAEMFILTLLFLWISREVFWATKDLVRWIVPPQSPGTITWQEQMKHESPSQGFATTFWLILDFPGRIVVAGVALWLVNVIFER